MDSLRVFYHHHDFALWVALLLVVFVVALWLLVVQLQARRLNRRIDGVFRGVSQENMATVLAEYLGIVRSTAQVVNQVKREHDEIAAMVPGAIRHVGLVRFSPFHDTGGDQSFTLALLDGRNDGVVITALHSRTDSRLYAKPIEHGASSYVLTPEEREAMDRAVKRSPVRARA